MLGVLHEATGYLQQTIEEYAIVKLDLSSENKTSFSRCVAFSIKVADVTLIDFCITFCFNDYVASYCC